MFQDTSLSYHHYDAFGRRIAKTSKIERLNKLNQRGELVKYPTTLLHLRKTDKTTYQSTLMLWEGNRQIQEYTDDLVFTTVYDDESFIPVARVVQVRNPKQDNGQGNGNDEVGSFKIYHYHNNHLGTPQELTDDDGNVVWANYEYAWGGRYQSYYQTQSICGTIIAEEELQPIRFQGQFYDVETGLHYNRFRYYDSDVGMFIQRDPIGLLGGVNVYQYVISPTGFVDPFGLCSWNTARKNFWINEAKTNPHKYSARNLALMAQGKAPRFKAKIEILRTGEEITKDISMELHHTYLPQRSGSKKAHECWNLTIVNPWAHEAMDKYRHTGTKLQKIIKGVNSW